MLLLGHLKQEASRARGIIEMVFAPLLPNISLQPLNLKGKRALVTGGNAGIGFEIAHSLAKQGAEVWLLYRNAKKAEQARDELREMTWNHRVEYEIIDLASLKSVNEFVKRWGTRAEEERRVDILVNNAGLTICTKATTAEGFEMTYVVNFLSSFLLTILLLNHGYFSPDARIVQISSTAMYRSEWPDMDNLNSPDLLSHLKEGQSLSLNTSHMIYGRSKALQTVFTQVLQERLAASERWKDVVVQACHPGNVRTEFWKHSTGLGHYEPELKYIAKLIDAVGITPQQGAIIPVFLSTSPDAAKADVRGKFWMRCSWRWPLAWMGEKLVRVELWAKWEEDAEVDASKF